MEKITILMDFIDSTTYRINWIYYPHLYDGLV